MRRVRAARGVASVGVALLALLAPPEAVMAALRPQDEASDAAADAPPPVAQRATDLLRAMGGTLAAARQMTFRASCVEAVVDTRTGRTVHLLTDRRIALARPDRLHVVERDGVARHELWLDAGRLTVVNATSGRFAEAAMPPTVDATLDRLHEDHGLAMPFADLLVDDPYAVLSAAIETGIYLGEAHAAGQRCHHLAFSQPDLDWQVWIEADGGPPVPRKLVITQVREPGQPQFTAVLSDWNLAPSFEEDIFTPAVPPEAVRVDLAGLTDLTGDSPPAPAKQPPADPAEAPADPGQVRRGPALPPLAGLVGLPEAAPVARRAPQRRSGGGVSGGRAAPRSRGAVRPHARGTVRHYRPSRPSRPSRGVSTRSERSRMTHRSSASGRSTDGRTTTSAMRRIPRHGSLRAPGPADRSFVARQRASAARDRRTLRDPADPADIDAWRQERRDRLGDTARRYRHDDRWYFYDAGGWWAPYYDDDEVVYVTIDPPVGLTLESLPPEAVEIIVGDTVYLEANGVYYARQEDDTFIVIAAPDLGRPDPVSIVRRALGFVRDQPAFTLVATDTMDHVQADGRKLQSETTRTFHLRRPDALAVTARGDDLDRSAWYDGTTLTIVDRLEAAYAVTEAPDTVDATIDLAVSQLGVNLPLSDLLLADPFAALTGALRHGAHLGLVDADGVTCHHLAFSTPAVDWELWVDAGERPLPVMLAITYAGVPEHPTYFARFDAWELDPEFAPDTFAASIPEGLERIPFTTPLAEVQRLESALEAHRTEHQRIAQYIASQRTIELFGRIADKPEAARRIEQEQARLETLGAVSPDEVQAYLDRKQELERELRHARRAARR